MSGTLPDMTSASIDGVKATPFIHGKFTLYAAKDFHGLLRPTYLIEGVFPSSGLVCVYGASGVGKSFVCLDMAGAVARGEDWFGHKTKKAQVVYVVLEGRAGIRQRTEAWAKQVGTSYPEGVTFLFDPVALNNPDDVRALANTIMAFGGADLLIIDTLNRAAPGADENSSADMGKILAGASTLQEAIGGLVLLVHHPGKDLSRGLRGHSSLLAALDAVLEVERNETRRWWKISKAKDDEEGIIHVFNLTLVELEADGSGKAHKSCAVEHAIGESVQQLQKEPRGDNQRVILPAFKELLAQRKLRSITEGTEWPDGISFEDAVSALKEVLEDVEPKRRRERTEAALMGLVKVERLALTDNMLSLPSQPAS